MPIRKEFLKKLFKLQSWDNKFKKETDNERKMDVYKISLHLHKILSSVTEYKLKIVRDETFANFSMIFQSRTSMEQIARW